MTSQSTFLIRAANALAVCLCVAWFAFDPGFEPVITGVLLAAGFLVPLQPAAAEEHVSPSSSPAQTVTFSSQPRSSVPMPAELPPELGGHQPSITVHRGDLLVLKGVKGIAVVEIKPLKGPRAKYRWRFAPQLRGPEETGTGELFEQYARTQRDVSLITDVGGELLVKAGPYKIEWSQGGPEHGYVYPSGSEYFAYVVPDASLGNFRL